MHVCVYASCHASLLARNVASREVWLHAKLKAASKAGSRQQVTTCRYGTDLTLLFATQGSSPVLEAILTCAATGGVVQRTTPVVFGGRPTRVRRRAGTAPAKEAHKNVQVVETLRAE